MTVRSRLAGIEERLRKGDARGLTFRRWCARERRDPSASSSAEAVLFLDGGPFRLPSPLAAREYLEVLATWLSDDDDENPGLGTAAPLDER